MDNSKQSPILRQTPIRRAKLHELVAGKIEGMIRTAELKPGDRLPSERDLMSAFDIGRPAVREALLALENKGMIITENGRRARVRVPSVDNVFSTLDGVVRAMINQPESLKNLFDARTFIETATARHAADTMTESRMTDLKTALDENRRAIRDGERFMQTDVAFHRVLFRTLSNPVFDAVHAALVDWLMERWRKIERTDATRALAYKGHLRIYRAVENGDASGAERAMRKHLYASWSIWSKQLVFE